jgi:hypothetical protein
VSAARDPGPGRGGAAFDTVGVSESQSDARATVSARPRHIEIVVRGRPRAAVFNCPCGCGDVLSINVDKEADRAWRLLWDGGSISLLPSVRRTSGCRSHFVLWRSDVWWCGDAADEWLETADLDSIDQWLQSLIRR